MAKETTRKGSKDHKPERRADSKRGKNEVDKRKTFKRHRDDARPSDLGSAESRRNTAPTKKVFSKDQPDFKERTSGFKREEDKSFKRKPDFKERASDFKREENKPFKDKSDFKERSSGFKREGDKPFFKKDKPGNLKKTGASVDKKSFKKQEEQDFDFNDFYDDGKSSEKVEKTGKGGIKHARPYERKPYVKKTYSKKSDSKPHKSSDDGTIRLNKYLSNAGICSRREADQLISTGVVSVNGKIITEMGFKIKPTDIIKYGGQTLKKEKLVYLILNKPKDYITTIDDPQKRRTVLELVQNACKERIYPVGRLDRATTGLLLFTNDGELTKKLTHPRYGVRKIYHVELDKPLKKSDFDKIVEGVELEDGLIKVDEISYVGDGKNKSDVGIEIHSGKNRIVRRLFEQLGYNVRKLDRVMFGPLTKKDLPKGRWRFITDAELGMLKMVSSD